ncbi:hypothetical protein PG987_016381 [Apiospora arundinis]
MSATPSIMVPGGIRRKPVPEAQKRPPSPEVYDLLDDYYSEGDSNPPPYSLVEQPREDPRYNIQHRDNVRYQAQDRDDSRYQDRPRPPTKAATIPLVIPTVNHFPPPPPPPQASPTPTPAWPPAGSPHSNAAATTVHYFPPPPPPGPPTPTSAWTPTGQTLHSKASTNSLRAQSDYGFPPPPPPPGPPHTRICVDADITHTAFQDVDEFIENTIRLWIPTTSTTHGEHTSFQGLNEFIEITIGT